MSKHNFVEVEWLDANSTDATWARYDTIDEVPAVLSYGFLIKVTDKSVALAGSIGAPDDGTYAQVLSIPIGMIKSMRIVTLQTKAKVLVE